MFHHICITDLSYNTGIGYEDAINLQFLLLLSYLSIFIFSSLSINISLTKNPLPLGFALEVLTKGGIIFVN